MEHQLDQTQEKMKENNMNQNNLTRSIREILKDRFPNATEGDIEMALAGIMNIFGEAVLQVKMEKV